MIVGSEWRWRFCGFESAEEQQPVQSWFDGLPEDVKDEMGDLLRHLEKMTTSLWRKPEYDPLDGEPFISELRGRSVTIMVDGKLKTFTPRIYGFFGPDPRTYTFLHGTNKNARNDTYGKRIARERLEKLLGGAAAVHEFKF
jgi:hypothetical protein